MFLSGLDTTDRFARSIGSSWGDSQAVCGGLWAGIASKMEHYRNDMDGPFSISESGSSKATSGRNERFSRRQTDRFARFDALHVRSHDLYSRLHTFLPSFLASKFNALPANMNPA